MLADLQANILKPHGRENVLCCSLRFSASEPFRNFVRAASDHVTDALTHLAAIRQYRQSMGRTRGAPLVSLAISAAGYRLLGVPTGVLPTDVAFRAGMQARKRILSDPDSDALEKAYASSVHALLLVAADTAHDVAASADALMREFSPYIRVTRELGKVWRNQHGDPVEHFGFADGLSRVEIASHDPQRERKRDIAPLSTALVRCAGGARDTSFGTYLVFRKLEQDVRGFHRAQQDLALALGLPDSEKDRAAAQTLGRFADGTPITLSPVADAVIRGAEFDFESDPLGARCPAHAHIRKMNPRDGTERLILRRSASYGSRASAPGAHQNEGDLPSRDVGMLFICYQASIVSQFEYLQVRANTRESQHGTSGMDTLAGQGERLIPEYWPRSWGDQTSKAPFLFRQYVTLKGGEYFFVPSLSFLRHP
jgi:Dyp-type peroxidase family